MTFSERLIERTAQYGPLCVGIDPHASILKAWGLDDTPEGLARFTSIILETFTEVTSVKPQVAFYERFGSAGYVQLERLIGTMRDRGVLVIADAKRGDIGSTMEGYSHAWLTGPLESDAVTLSPYLGVASLKPAFELCSALGKGAFVLGITSNPEGASLQEQVSQDVLNEIGHWNSQLWDGPGSIGVVIGATASDRLQAWGIDTTVINGPVLAPGVGAQGASIEDARRVAGPHPLIVPISRGILKAGPEPDKLWAAYEEAK